MFKLLPIERRSEVLKRSVFGCLRDVPSINITKGCIHSCVYCYARGFPEAPPEGEVHIYKNLPEILERELSRKNRLPAWISFSTASDAFQDIDEVLDITYSCMKLALERGIGISFLTKGYIPEAFIGIFKRYPKMVKARIGIVSLDEGYKRLFEPFTASPLKRLENIKALIKAGIEVSVRIDPVIPSITDSERDIENLLKELYKTGVKEVSVSSLVMRPLIMDTFKKLHNQIFWRIMKLYRGEPWQRVITSARTRLLPLELRRTIYRRFREIGSKYGLNIRLCGCKNPDLPWEFCSPWVEDAEIKKQLLLFGEENNNIRSYNGYS
jgi:DNA repair photolyase